MKIENVKHLKLTLEIAARGDYCDVSCPFMFRSMSGRCRLFGALRINDQMPHRIARHFHCIQFTKGSDDERVS
jgi:hypothetical protein